MSKGYKLLFLLFFTFFMMSGLYAQTCMFVSNGTGFDPNAQDVVLIDWLTNTLGYTVDVAQGSDVKSGFYSTEDFQAYDFVFVSESVSSSDTGPLKGAPVPIFYTECWASKWDITGWVPNNASPLYYGNTTSDQTTVKILNGDSPLAAGYATGTELTIVTDSENSTDYLTYSNPQVDHIAVAALTADETHLVVFGVEAGTAIYEAEKNDGEFPDGSMISENRCAAVGVNANANAYLTDDAYKLMEAGINWVLSGPTAVGDEKTVTPEKYSLGQNYPNPFNPTTNIDFVLEKNAKTMLTVYNVLGQKVATLADAYMTAGTHTVQFDASDLQSGVYFYQLVSGNFNETHKMMLVK